MGRTRSLSYFSLFISWLARLGVSKKDNDELRLKKAVLTLTSFIIAFLAIFWGSAYIALELPRSGYIPLAYALISFSSMLFFFRTKSFAFFRFSQLLLILVLPFLLQWSLGGFAQGSVVMLWALMSPLAALFFGDIKLAWKWVGAFLSLTLISGFIDPFLVQQSTASMPAWANNLFFVLNVGGVSVTIFIVLLYFHNDREEARIAAIKANKAKSDFLANMSHEIRTPLTAIIGFSETLLNSSQPVKERVASVNTITRAGKHLLRIINEILDVSKIEANQLEIEHLKFHPFEILQEVESLVSLQTEEKGLTFNIDYHYPLPEYIDSDPLRLKQILFNLCSNAVKFTKDGGINIIVNHSNEQKRLSIQIVDTGIGMTPEQMDKLFKPFSQADTSTTRKYGGTGLGLYLCKQLTEKLGGRLVVESAPGKGSCFTVELDTSTQSTYKMIDNYPLNNSQTEVQEISYDSEIIKGNLLLVEDNLDNQRLIALYLRQLGITPKIANNGREAVTMAMNGDFDLILMDMLMPVMDGYTATEHLRTQGFTKPILALTANALNEDRERCVEAGCDDMLTKPIDRDKFNELLHKYMPIVQEVEENSIPIYSSLAFDDPELAELLNNFNQNLPEMIQSLEEALVRNDMDVMKSSIHELKGVSGNYGYHEIFTLAQEIEKEITKNNLNKVGDLLSKLNKLEVRVESNNSDSI